MESTICNGEVVISSKLSETHFSVLYEGYIASTGEPCLIKQYKDQIDCPEISRELKIFKTVKYRAIPRLIRENNESDGFFVVLSTINGHYLHHIIQNYSALTIIEIRNILIELYHIIELLGRNNVAITSLPFDTIIFSPDTHQVVFLDITNNTDIISDKKGNLLKEMAAVKEFIEKAVPWVLDTSNLEAFWMQGDKVFLSFYNVLSNNPLESPKHEFLKKELTPVTDMVDQLSSPYLD